MILKQVYILSCLVIYLNAASISLPSELKRPKRTIQYFLDGLFSAFKERLPMNARTINDHRTSTLVSLAKLSSISTPPRNIQTFDDDHDDQSIIENTLNLPIPSIASTLLASAENRVPQLTMKKRAEIDDIKMINQSNTNVSQVEKTVTKTSTVAPSVAPSEIQTIEMNVLNRTQATTMTPNLTQTTTTTTTMTAETAMTTEELNQVVTEVTTIKPENNTDSMELSTLDPLELAMMDTIKNQSSNMDDTRTKMEKRNAPMKASNLHTTQFFDGPLVVESDRSGQHKPIYLDDCIEINCNKVPRTLSDGSRIAPIISMQIALPASTSNIDQRRQNTQSPIQNYHVFTLHAHIPIHTQVNSKRLSNEIIDPPMALTTH